MGSHCSRPRSRPRRHPRSCFPRSFSVCWTPERFTVLFRMCSSACSGSNPSSSSLIRLMASKKLLVDTGAPRSRRCPQNRAEGDGDDPVEQDHGPEEEERDEEQRRRHVQPAGQGPGVARLVAWRSRLPLGYLWTHSISPGREGPVGNSPEQHAHGQGKTLGFRRTAGGRRAARRDTRQSLA